MNTWGSEQQQEYISRVERGDIKVKPHKYGLSVLGAPLHMYSPNRWSNNRTLIIAGIHGEEPETSNTLSYALRSIKPEHLRCAVIIAANPDGMAHGIRGNNNNVDLNRNFPTNDWQVGITTTRWEISLPKDVKLACGTFPASEPEVSSLINVIEEYQIEQIISLHAPMACINYEQDSNWPLIKKLNTALKLPIVRDIGYPCPGSMGAWSVSKNIRQVTIEMEGALSLSKTRQKYGPVIQQILLAKFPGI